MVDAIRPKAAIPISASLKVEDAKVLARSTETIPDAANWVNQRISLLFVDLPPHAPDIDVDDVGRWIEVKDCRPEWRERNRREHRCGPQASCRPSVVE